MKIIIVGGGSSGWMAAAYLSNKCKFDVSLIESNNVKIVGVGESTITSIVDFLEHCGVNDNDVHEHCNAVRKYKINHNNWTKRLDSWDHWFCYEGDDLNDNITAMNNYIAGPKGRFAYHLDANQLPVLLKLKSPNVNHIIDDVMHVNVDDNGVKSIQGKHGIYSADFYIDCSGSASVIRKNFPSTFKSHKNLINNYAIAGPTPYSTGQVPSRFTQTFSMNYGWRWKIDLQHRSGNGYVFNKDFISVDRAVDEFVHATGIDEKNIFEVPILNKYNTVPMYKNVVSIGLSCGFLEPLEATGMFLNYRAIEFFEQFLNHPNRERVFNRMWTNMYEGIAAFLELFYTTSDLDHTEYWRSFNKVKEIIFRPNFPKYPSWIGLANHRGVTLRD
jgi:tryptophan halogenase